MQGRNITANTLTEVGPRDGLQAVDAFIPTAIKLEYICCLIAAGLKRIEVTSFVSPKAIPQLADAAILAAQLPREHDVIYTALVPNMIGLKAALAAKMDEVAVFASASEGFSQHNIGCDIATSLQTYQHVVASARTENLPVRGYISCCWTCPYDGVVESAQVANLVDALSTMGCYQVVLSDTTGMATPDHVSRLLHTLFELGYPPELFAMHFHNTAQQGLANAETAYELGVVHFDTATGGLGGCPNAPGSSGNLATEALVEAYGLEIDLAQLTRASGVIADAIAQAS